MYGYRQGLALPWPRRASRSRVDLRARRAKSVQRRRREPGSATARGCTAPVTSRSARRPRVRDGAKEKGAARRPRPLFEKRSRCRLAAADLDDAVARLTHVRPRSGTCKLGEAEALDGQAVTRTRPCSRGRRPRPRHDARRASGCRRRNRPCRCGRRPGSCVEVSAIMTSAILSSSGLYSSFRMVLVEVEERVRLSETDPAPPAPPRR